MNHCETAIGTGALDMGNRRNGTADLPGEKIGAIGSSLGGAAALLGPHPLPVDALVLESVYPDIGAATGNRIRAVLGWPIGALVAPKGTPDAVLRRLDKALSDALDSAPVKERLTKLGNTVVPPSQRTAEYFVPFLRGEITKWTGALKATGLSLD